jgi:arylsulfatase A-like enzyme
MIIFDPKANKSNRKRTSQALVQSIDIAPTMLSMAGIPVPSSYQGKDLSGLLLQKEASVRSYIYTENLWSTQFGNPRCESVQDKEWKYIRYYKNDNFSALKKIETAEAMGIKVSSMLYKVHDPDIAVYRDYIEGPLNGEPAVYEELFNLNDDPGETTNLATKGKPSETLSKMRAIWEKEIKIARGEGLPKVYRYTTDSEAERGVIIEPK